MANLGTLDSVATTQPGSIVQSVPSLVGARYSAHPTANFWSTTRPSPPNGALIGITLPPNTAYQRQAASAKRISGIVQEYGVNVSRLVRAYARSTGMLLGEATSNGTTGAFSISIYNFSGEVFVVAFDDTGANPDLNAQIFDRVTPV